METSSMSTNMYTYSTAHHAQKKTNHTLSDYLDLRGSSVTTFSSQSLCEREREMSKQNNKRKSAI